MTGEAINTGEYQRRDIPIGMTIGITIGTAD